MSTYTKFEDETRTREEVEERLGEYVEQHAQDGSPDNVLAVVDDYCWSSNNWMMHIGDQKGVIIDEILRNAQPRVILELGTYCGYSAVRFSRFLPYDGVYYTIDPNARPVSDILIRKSGSNKIVKLAGTAAQVIPMLKDRGIDTVDVVFIDHEKSLYLSDLLLIEEYGLLHEGSLVIADNVIVFKLDDYLHHVRQSGHYSKSTIHMAHVEYSEVEDGVEVSVYKG